MLQHLFLILVALQLPLPCIFLIFPTAGLGIVLSDHILVLFLGQLNSLSEIPYLLYVLLKFLLDPIDYCVLLADSITFDCNLFSY